MEPDPVAFEVPGEVWAFGSLVSGLVVLLLAAILFSQVRR